jgi:hypothetical protein
MAVVRGVELFWVKCDIDNPDRYQGKGSAKWTVQFRVKTKKQKEELEKEYGFKFSPVEGEDGKLVYKSSISRFAFKADATGEENLKDPNEPVKVIGGNLAALDPNTVGNGSVGNISFYFKDDKSGRTLKGIQVTEYKVFERQDANEFEEEPFEIIGGDEFVPEEKDVF